jgi:hypothetical protein
MENLPSEVWSIIFSFLDKKSRKSSTSTCQLWFDVIRNSNLTNHIRYKGGREGGVEELQQRIENLEWDWKRWPALKIFEIQGYVSSGKRDLLNDLSIDFKQCPTLEMVIFPANIGIADFCPNCPRNVARIIKLAYNPQLDITQFGVDHIWSLYIWGQNDEVFKMINEYVKGIKKLIVSHLSYLDNLVCMDALHELQIVDHSSSELKLKNCCLKKLKTLVVGKLAQLDNLVGMDALLELSVAFVNGGELKEYDLSNIAKRFKNLQKCDIDVDYVDGDLIQPKAYVEIVESIFQNSNTRINIVFNKVSSYYNPIKEFRNSSNRMVFGTKK